MSNMASPSTPARITWKGSSWKGFALNIFHLAWNYYLGRQLNKSIDFKIALLTYKVLHGRCPASLNSFMFLDVHSNLLREICHLL